MRSLFFNTAFCSILLLTGVAHAQANLPSPGAPQDNATLGDKAKQGLHDAAENWKNNVDKIYQDWQKTDSAQKLDQGVDNIKQEVQTLKQDVADKAHELGRKKY